MFTVQWQNNIWISPLYEYGIFNRKWWGTCNKVTEYITSVLYGISCWYRFVSFNVRLLKKNLKCYWNGFCFCYGWFFLNSYNYTYVNKWFLEAPHFHWFFYLQHYTFSIAHIYMCKWLNCILLKPLNEKQNADFIVKGICMY